MNGRERVLATLHKLPTDHLCWSPLIGPYFNRSLPELGYEELCTPDAVRLVGGDIIERHVRTIERVFEGSIQEYTEGDDACHQRIIETPVGKLVTERRASDSGHTHYVSKRPVTCADDLRVMQYLYEHTTFRQDYGAYRERDAYIGEDGIASSSGPLTPIQHFLQFFAGVQTTVFLLADNRRAVEDCFDAMHHSNLEAYRMLAEGPAESIWIYEDTSSTVINPRLYKRYCAPLIDEYADICHAQDKVFITHMCGKLSAFNEQLRAGKQDGVDSVCPPTTGDIWAHEAREAWGPEKVIVGGIEPPALAMMSESETRDYVHRVIDQMPTFRGFILSTGDAVSYATPVENLRAVAEIAENTPYR